MLTAKQLLIITSNRSTAPWRMKDLRNIFAATPLSLRSLLDGVGGQQLVLFLEIRDISILTGANTFDDFLTKWKSSAPTKATLAQLAQILATTGASLILSAHSWRSVGIKGPVTSLVGVPTIKINRETFDGAKDIANSLVAAGTVLGGLGVVTADPALAIVGADIALTGAIIQGTVGVIEHILDQPDATVPSGGDIPSGGTIPTVVIVGQPEPGAIKFPDVTIVGTLPVGMSDADVTDAQPVNPDDVPDPPPPEPEPPDL
jgi:hypothetical protein